MNKVELFAYYIIGCFVFVFLLITLFDPVAEWHRGRIKKAYRFVTSKLKQIFIKRL